MDLTTMLTALAGAAIGWLVRHFTGKKPPAAS